MYKLSTTLHFANRFFFDVFQLPDWRGTEGTRASKSVSFRWMRRVSECTKLPTHTASTLDVRGWVTHYTYCTVQYSTVESRVGERERAPSLCVRSTSPFLP